MSVVVTEKHQQSWEQDRFQGYQEGESSCTMQNHQTGDRSAEMNPDGVSPLSGTGMNALEWHSPEA